MFHRSLERIQDVPEIPNEMLLIREARPRVDTYNIYQPLPRSHEWHFLKYDPDQPYLIIFLIRKYRKHVVKCMHAMRIILYVYMLQVHGR